MTSFSNRRPLSSHQLLGDDSMTNRPVQAASILLVAGVFLGGLPVLVPAGSTTRGKQPGPGAKPDAPSPQRHEQLATLPFAENRPTKETAQALRDELQFQRATQTYLWALPLINTLGMKVGSERKFGAGYNVLPVWKKRLDAKTLVTTPNSDVIYAMSYVDLSKDGPLVFEAPPKLQGILLDFWQRPIPGPTVDKQQFFGDVGFA